MCVCSCACVCVRASDCAHVPVCVSKCVGAHVSALEERARACGCACVHVLCI